MKPFRHAKGSVGRWGGKPEDYMAIHDFIDSTKIAMPDLRHRAVLHNAFGCFLVERVFGRTIVNSDGREISTRDIAEEHILEDMGFIPSLEDWLDELPLSTWHGGIHRIPKDQRPPTPAEERAATRDRVRSAIGALIGCGAIGHPLSDKDADLVIAAVRSVEKHKETD